MKTALAIILMVALLATAAAAHVTPPHVCDSEHPAGVCPAGEACGVTGTHEAYGSCLPCPSHQEYGPWGESHNGGCPGNENSATCEQWGSGSKHHHHRDVTTVYTCHETGYAPCDGANHEKKITAVNDYGCIAQTCPAIPCPDGTHCTENECIPDVCGVDFTCEAGFHCEGQTCVVDSATEIQTSGFFPYTADPNAPGTCEGALTQEADIETHALEGRPLLISLESCGPNGCAFVDTFRVYYLYETGDPSCNSAATVRQYFSRCAMDSRSGTGPLVIPLNGEVERIRVIGAKDEVTYPAATQLRVTITEAYTGRLVWPLTPAETDQAVTHGDETIYDHTLGLDTDLAGCRPNNAEGSGWIFGIPTPLPTVTPKVA